MKPRQPRQLRKSATTRAALEGSLWLSVEGQPLGDRGRLGLLRALAQEGSITRAARSFGLSYKAAWDAIDEMNRTASRPLVERSTGGRGGGSTRLTDYGQKLLERLEQVQAVHRRFLQLLDLRAMDLERDFSLLEVMTLRSSARNQWLGIVSAVRCGAVNDEVEIELPGGLRLWAMITRGSTESLELRPGMPVVAMVKAPAVLVVLGLDTQVRISARNRLAGHVEGLRPGAVHSEVRIQAAPGLEVVAIVPQEAVADLGLAVGSPVTALIQASDVVLATVV